MPLEQSSEALTSSRPAVVSVKTFTEAIIQGETGSYSVQLTGPNAAAIADTDFSAITLTYVDEATLSVINSRNEQDVLNANNVTLSATALLTWSIQAADTTFVDPSLTRMIEYHRAIFTFTFDIGSGTEVGIHEVRIPIRKAFTATVQSLS